MDQDKTYQEFIGWLAQAPMTFPASDDTIALIKARYTPEDAELLTNVPYKINVRPCIACLGCKLDPLTANRR